jgi:hypothetical protein
MGFWNYDGVSEITFGWKTENCKFPHEMKLKSPSEGKDNTNISGFCALSVSAVQRIQTVWICYGLGFLSAVIRDTGRSILMSMLHSRRRVHILYSFFFARCCVKAIEKYKVPFHYKRRLRAHTQARTHTHLYISILLIYLIFLSSVEKDGRWSLHCVNLMTYLFTST